MPSIRRRTSVGIGGGRGTGPGDRSFETVMEEEDTHQVGGNAESMHQNPDSAGIPFDTQHVLCSSSSKSFVVFSMDDLQRTLSIEGEAKNTRAPEITGKWGLVSCSVAVVLTVLCAVTLFVPTPFRSMYDSSAAIGIRTSRSAPQSEEYRYPENIKTSSVLPLSEGGVKNIKASSVLPLSEGDISPDDVRNEQRRNAQAPNLLAMGEYLAVGDQLMSACGYKAFVDASFGLVLTDLQPGGGSGAAIVYRYGSCFRFHFSSPCARVLC